MVLINENSDSVYISCDCGCSGIHLNKVVWDDGEVDYFLSLSVNAFYEWQGLFNRLKQRFILAWNILRHGSYKFAEIYLKKDEFEKLKDMINKF